MSTPQQEDYQRRILRVLVHVQAHLDEDLSLEDLAQVACFSPFHFHRVFRGMVGESVAQHVRRLRLERAAQCLRHTDRPILPIALSAGYESQEAFTRSFRSAFGLPPRQYRATHGVVAKLAVPSAVHYVQDSAELEFTPLTSKESAMEVVVAQLPPLRVAFLRHVGPYHEVGNTWEKLMDWAGRECLFVPGVQIFGACWDDPEVTPADKLRYDACITVGAEVQAEGEIGIQTLGGGRVAKVLHEGPYDGLAQTYAEFFGQWLPASGHEPGDPPCMEFYLNDPGSTEPEDLLTEICTGLRA